VSWYTSNPSAAEFEISTAAELRGLAVLVNDVVPTRFGSKTVKLANDIDLGGENFTPIGKDLTYSFEGIFDGQGHTISGLSVSEAQYAGLFGYFGSNLGGQIKNVNVIASKIRAAITSTSNSYAGGLAGYYASAQPIQNCSVYADSIIASANSSDAHAGGLAGYLLVPSTNNTMSIENSYANANVFATTSSYYAYAGGLAGYEYGNSIGNGIAIENSHSSGSVFGKGRSSYSGGLIGYIDNRVAASIVNSHSTSNVSAINTSTMSANYLYSGGLVGFNYSGAITIANSYSAGNVFAIGTDNSGNSSAYSGGLIGNNGSVPLHNIANSYSIGDIFARVSGTGVQNSYSGGLIGYEQPNNGIEITNSYAGGNISGEVIDAANPSKTPFLGGIFGRYAYHTTSSFTSVYYNSDAVGKAAGTVCSGSTCDDPILGIAGISGKSAAALKTQATFTGWDFASTWGIAEAYSMPFLRAEANNLFSWISSKSYIYTGSPIKPEPKIWSKSNATLLTKGTDYALVYGENKNAGTGTITVTGIGAYAGLSDFISFSIEKKELTVSSAQVTAKTYDGTTDAAITGATLQGVCGSDDVALANLTGTFASENAGTGISVEPHFSLSGNDIGNYTLTLPALAGNIAAKPLATDAIQQPIPKQIYNGGLAITPTLVVKNGSITLVEDADYTVYYSNNTALGTATASATGIGNYTGTRTVEFEIASSHIPFAETFENGENGWVFVNGTQANKWIIGTDTYNGGSYSAYISSNGWENRYAGSTSTTHLYKDIVFPESSVDFTLTYYFKGVGELYSGKDYDYMVLKYRETSSAPTAGTSSAGTHLDSIRGLSSWTKRTVSLPATAFSGKTMRLVFTWKNDNATQNQPPAAIDDIDIRIDPSSVSSPTLASKTHNSITINPVAPPVSGQEVEYARNTANSVPSSSWQTALSFENLSANTTYYIFARAKQNENYAAGKASAALSATTNTPPTLTVPFIETFESGANNWVLVNGSQTNKWVIGTNVSYSGSRSAYISNSILNTNEYTITSRSIVHLYRDITFPTSTKSFNLTFWLKGMGEETWDYMTVRYSNTSSTPTEGSESGTLLAGYWGNSSWSKKEITLPAATFSGKTMRLIFTWKNDDSGGTQPPAAIDDISIYVSGDTPPTPPTGSSSSLASSSSSSTLSSSSSSSTLGSSSSNVASSSSSSVLSSSSSSTLGSSSSSGSATPVLLTRIATANSAIAAKSSIVLQVQSNAHLQIYDLSGKLQKTLNFKSGVYNVPLGYLPKGMYIANVKFGNGDTHTLRIAQMNAL
jgi:hypothetical protein